MARAKMRYDKDRDVFYASVGNQSTRNLPWTPNEDICFDPESCEVVGYVITNFSVLYPELVKRWNPSERWFVVAFFETRLNDWNKLLAPLRTWKARTDFLSREQAHRSGHLAHH